MLESPTALTIRSSKRAAADAGSPSHATRLRNALKAVDALPAQAAAKKRFLDSASAAGASAAGLASVAESDPAIAARLLRLANRAADSHSGAVVSTAGAIELLGRDRACTAIARLPHYSLLDGQNDWEDEVDRFRMHALAVRAAAIALATELADPNPDRIATTALLHDIGKLALARVHSGYPDATAGVGEPDERAAAERAALGLDHATIGGVIARRWRLPGVLSAGIENHHAEDGGGDSALVRLADMLVHRSNGTRIPLARLCAAAERVGLSRRMLAAMLDPRAVTATAAPTERCPLTPRQLEMVRALAAGKHYKEIAGELGLSASTIRSHLHEAYRRLGVADRAQAVLVSAERGWIGRTHLLAATG